MISALDFSFTSFLRKQKISKTKSIHYLALLSFSPTFSTAPLYIVYPTAADIAPLVQSALHESRAD